MNTNIANTLLQRVHCVLRNLFHSSAPKLFRFLFRLSSTPVVLDLKGAQAEGGVMS